MNKLTAIRTFAAPGFTPAKRVKIFADRYYFVRMQNVETDPRADYVGLGEGEYTELLTGTAARARRDARLNHCNAIAEYSGPVFAVLTSSYGNWDATRKPSYFPTEADAFNFVVASRAEHDKWVSDCLKQAVYYLNLAQAVREGTAKSIMTPEHLEESAKQSTAVADKNADTFKSETLQVR